MIQESHHEPSKKSLERALRKFDGSDEPAFIERHFRSVCTVSNFGEWISRLSVKSSRRFCPIVHDVISSRYQQSEGRELAHQLALMIGQADRKPAIVALLRNGRNSSNFSESLSVMSLNVPDKSVKSRWKLEVRARQFELVKEYDIANIIYSKISERDLELREANRRLRNQHKKSYRSMLQRGSKVRASEALPDTQVNESAGSVLQGPSVAQNELLPKRVANVLPPAAMIVVPEHLLVDFSTTLSKAQTYIESADTLYLASALSRHDRWRLSLAQDVEIGCGEDQVLLSAMSVDSGEGFFTIGIYGPNSRLQEIVRLSSESTFSPTAGTIESVAVGAIVYLFGSPDRLRVSHSAGDEKIVSKCWGSGSSHSATYRPNTGFDWGQLNGVVNLRISSPEVFARNPHDVRGYIQYRRGKPVRVRPYRKGDRT